MERPVERTKQPYPHTCLKIKDFLSFANRGAGSVLESNLLLPKHGQCDRHAWTGRKAQPSRRALRGGETLYSRSRKESDADGAATAVAGSWRFHGLAPDGFQSFTW